MPTGQYEAGVDPGIFYWRGPNFGSERIVELLRGRLLLTEMTTCFSICERPVTIGTGNTAL